MQARLQHAQRPPAPTLVAVQERKVVQPQQSVGVLGAVTFRLKSHELLVQRLGLAEARLAVIKHREIAHGRYDTGAGPAHHCLLPRQAVCPHRLCCCILFLPLHRCRQSVHGCERVWVILSERVPLQLQAGFEHIFCSRQLVLMGVYRRQAVHGGQSLSVLGSERKLARVPRGVEAFLRLAKLLVAQMNRSQRVQVSCSLLFVLRLCRFSLQQSHQPLLHGAHHDLINNAESSRLFQRVCDLLLVSRACRHALGRTHGCKCALKRINVLSRCSQKTLPDSSWHCHVQFSTAMSANEYLEDAPQSSQGDRLGYWLQNECD
mmetsp:Transcript_14866/g.30788  ORF Transcript_14866/g.30788 Transcript_14866/m.30788 type:complete len:319 (-) Transcript_14866:114-1070(-)